MCVNFDMFIEDNLKLFSKNIIFDILFFESLEDKKILRYFKSSVTPFDSNNLYNYRYAFWCKTIYFKYF